MVLAWEQKDQWNAAEIPEPSWFGKFMHNIDAIGLS